ncbi:hypothetical protein AAFN88_21180 [Pelagibius sp. CAU 1746]|uniref:hypothetical protein n=1 Tax=Pelagibius sp. CAU 1746 TaxID=3140370 RepID=UPI00325AD967
MTIPENPKNRDALVDLIASARRGSITYFDAERARGAADTVLRELKAAGVAIHRRRDQ